MSFLFGVGIGPDGLNPKQDDGADAEMEAPIRTENRGEGSADAVVTDCTP